MAFQIRRGVTKSKTWVNNGQIRRGLAKDHDGVDSGRERGEAESVEGAVLCLLKK